MSTKRVTRIRLCFGRRRYRALIFFINEMLHSDLYEHDRITLEKCKAEFGKALDYLDSPEGQTEKNARITLTRYQAVTLYDFLNKHVDEYDGLKQHLLNETMLDLEYIHWEVKTEKLKKEMQKANLDARAEIKLSEIEAWVEEQKRRNWGVS